MNVTAGRRLPDVAAGELPDVEDYRGAYWRDAEDTWWCNPPVNGVGIGRLTLHSITEHDDGTITVSPSILMQRGRLGSWHGYLERGVWKGA